MLTYKKLTKKISRNKVLTFVGFKINSVCILVVVKRSVASLVKTNVTPHKPGLYTYWAANF